MRQGGNIIMETLILPYNQELLRSDGGYFKPSGEIVFTNGTHERWARKYCEGDRYESLKRLSMISLGDAYLDEYWEVYKKEKNYTGRRQDIDVYESRNLSAEEIKILKIVEEQGISYRYMYSDFLVYILGWDKLETIMRECITTTCVTPYTRFYNYFLMGWRIDVFKPG